MEKKVTNCIGPEILDYELEKNHWEVSVPENLRGKRVSSEKDLAKLFDGEIIDSLEEGWLNPFTLFKVKKGDEERPVAYQCGSCKEIYMGPPKFQDYNDEGPLSGGEGYHVLCNGCDSILKESDLRMRH